MVVVECKAESVQGYKDQTVGRGGGWAVQCETHKRVEVEMVDDVPCPSSQSLAHASVSAALLWLSTRLDFWRSYCVVAFGPVAAFPVLLSQFVQYRSGSFRQFRCQMLSQWSELRS